MRLHIKKIFLLNLILLLFIISVAVAQVPGIFNYQGYLTDDMDSPLANKTYSITFSIYNHTGALLWTEIQSNVEVSDGVFNVQIPENPAAYPLPEFAGEMYLGIKIGADPEMSPRQQLTSVPFSIKSGDTDMLQGHIPDDFSGQGHLHDFGDINGAVSDGQVPNNITVNYAANAGLANSATSAGNADTVDSKHASDFAGTVHTHSGSAITSGTVADARVAGSIARDNEIMSTVLGSDGPGSGLNADYLDGMSSGSFLSSGSDYGRQGVADNLYESTQTLTNRYINDDRAETIQASTFLDLLSVVQLGTGFALDAESAGAIAVRGVSNGTSGAGVAGYNYITTGAGVFGQGGSKGVYGWVNASGAYGVYGHAEGANGVGVFGTGPGWAGYFEGNLFVDGEIHLPNNSNIVNSSGRAVFHTGWRGLFGDYTTINSGYDWTSGEPVSVVAGSNGVFFTKGNASGEAHAEVLASITTNGRIICNVIEIKGGSDLAEPFDTQRPELIRAGMLMSIDPENPGFLKVADQAYDNRVAGVVSGAGGINPGMVMTQEGSTVHGSTPIALSGRVYCLADAGHGTIKPGDMLTTSNRPGHAMPATDRKQAYGAVIGKAMTALDKGTGLVLVLVSLQ
ncbi:MAG: hypothetical protein GY699_06255 [Desulfobacteraceae bacterium]|nr:hypothetical protein [Desulfobacteraceae bacterium]